MPTKSGQGREETFLKGHPQSRTPSRRLLLPRLLRRLPIFGLLNQRQGLWGGDLGSSRVNITGSLPSQTII